jgi:hypothetical protein
VSKLRRHADPPPLGCRDGAGGGPPARAASRGPNRQEQRRGAPPPSRAAHSPDSRSSTARLTARRSVDSVLSRSTASSQLHAVAQGARHHPFERRASDVACIPPIRRTRACAPLREATAEHWRPSSLRRNAARDAIRLHIDSLGGSSLPRRQPISASCIIRATIVRQVYFLSPSSTLVGGTILLPANSLDG